MPYAHIRKKIPPNLSRRRSIPIEDHEVIRQRHKNGEAIRAIARSYKTDVRNQIRFIIFPELLARHKAMQKERIKDGRYYDRVKHNESMKKHRHYKQSIKDKLIT